MERCADEREVSVWGILPSIERRADEREVSVWGLLPSMERRARGGASAPPSRVSRSRLRDRTRTDAARHELAANVLLLRADVAGLLLGAPRYRAKWRCHPGSIRRVRRRRPCRVR